MEDGELKNVVEIEESEQIKEEEHKQTGIKIVKIVQQESEKIIEGSVKQMVENIVVETIYYEYEDTYLVFGEANKFDCVLLNSFFQVDHCAWEFMQRLTD